VVPVECGWGLEGATELARNFSPWPLSLTFFVRNNSPALMVHFKK
jgi:hypothetical protein